MDRGAWWATLLEVAKILDTTERLDMTLLALTFNLVLRLPRWLVVKNLPANYRKYKRCRFDPWVRKIPWRRARQTTLVFLPGESYGQRSLVGYSPWVEKSWTQLKGLSMHTCNPVLCFPVTIPWYSFEKPENTPPSLSLHGVSADCLSTTIAPKMDLIPRSVWSESLRCLIIIGSAMSTHHKPC